MNCFSSSFSSLTHFYSRATRFITIDTSAKRLIPQPVNRVVARHKHAHIISIQPRYLSSSLRSVIFLQNHPSSLLPCRTNRPFSTNPTKPEPNYADSPTTGSSATDLSTKNTDKDTPLTDEEQAEAAKIAEKYQQMLLDEVNNWDVPTPDPTQPARQRSHHYLTPGA